jgi:hypothetical protein
MIKWSTTTCCNQKVEVSWKNECWIPFELSRRKQGNFIVVEWQVNHWEHHRKWQRRWSWRW